MAEESILSQFDKDQQEIRALIWQNKIPVKIVLDKEQISNNEEPFPFYTFIQRVHLPIFYYEQMHQYFEKFAPVPRDQNDIWLEWNNKPISWNLPFGVTFDLNYKDESVSGEIQFYDKSEDSSIEQIPLPFYPINITLHYGPCKISAEYVPIPNIQGKTLLEIAFSNFRFTLKESLFIRNDNDQPLALLAVQDQNQLWNSYVKPDQEQFFKILDQLFQLKNHLQNNKPIKLPVRVYIEDYAGRIQLSYAIETGNETLGDLLVRYFPKILRSTDDSYVIISKKYKDLKVLCNGIICNLNMPLLYFYKHFSHYDGFTYICIQK